MNRATLWIRYGCCTLLGLAVIGLAAVHPDPTPDVPTTAGLPPGSGPY